MTLRLTPTMLRPRPQRSRRLPGERHEFKELRQTSESVRNLTPPQHLENGAIVSSRDHEVTRTDPLLLRIKELEAEVTTLRKQLESQK